MHLPANFDADRDLYIERHLKAPRSVVWTAWTTPDHLKKWWAPKPYITTECEMDLRPGGIFRTVMKGPDGTEMDGGAGCFLDVEDQSRVVFTDALGPGWRPNPEHFMTAIISFSDDGTGTRYSAHVLHDDIAARKRHEAMGFEGGWGTMITQLDAVAQSIAETV